MECPAKKNAKIREKKSRLWGWWWGWGAPRAASEFPPILWGGAKGFAGEERERQGRLPAVAPANERSNSSRFGRPRALATHFEKPLRYHSIRDRILKTQGQAGAALLPLANLGTAAVLSHRNYARQFAKKLSFEAGGHRRRKKPKLE